MPAQNRAHNWMLIAANISPALWALLVACFSVKYSYLVFYDLCVSKLCGTGYKQTSIMKRILSPGQRPGWVKNVNLTLSSLNSRPWPRVTQFGQTWLIQGWVYTLRSFHCIIQRPNKSRSCDVRVSVCECVGLSQTNNSWLCPTG